MKLKNYKKKQLKCKKNKVDNDRGNTLCIHSFVHSTWNN